MGKKITTTVQATKPTSNDKKKELAERIAYGIAGWAQMLYCQKLLGAIGEDSLRLAIAQMINSSGHTAQTSRQPKGWGGSGKRIDLAIYGRSTEASDWLGACEVKWLAKGFDEYTTRSLIVEDAYRLALVPTNNLNATLLVVGGLHDRMDKLMNHVATTYAKKAGAKTRGVSAKDQQAAFAGCFNQVVNNTGSIDRTNLTKVFPKFNTRVAQSASQAHSGGIKLKLLAKGSSHLGSNEVVVFYVWQCDKL